MSRKQRIGKIKLAILSCLIIFSFITEKVSLVYADSTATVNILFEQIFKDEAGNIATGETRELIYELTAKESGIPMPVGSIGDVFETSLTGNANGSIDIVFDRAGDFEYQLKASSKNDLSGLVAQGEVYDVYAYIRKTINGDIVSFATIVKNQAGDKVVDPPFEYTVLNPYVVTHKFVSGTAGRTLPREVTDLLPSTITGLNDGETVSVAIIPPAGSTVTVSDGVWTFKGWDKNSVTIDGADAQFTGTWIFEERAIKEQQFTVAHEFESGTPGKFLPSEVTDLLPPSQSGLVNGANISAPTTPAVGTIVNVDGGTWKFTGWDRDSLEIDGADETFVGTWIYTADPSQEQKHTVVYEFESGMHYKVLPSEVTDLLPPSKSGLVDGTVVSVSETPAIGTTVKVSDGVWIFVQWDRTSVTINGQDEKFVGTWIFMTTIGPMPTITPTPTGTPMPTGTPTPVEPTGTPIPGPTEGPSPSGAPVEPTVKPTAKPTPTRRPIVKPEQPGTIGKGGIAKTGDTTKVYTLIALALASTGVIVLAVAKRRKKDEE